MYKQIPQLPTYWLLHGKQNLYQISDNDVRGPRKTDKNWACQFQSNVYKAKVGSPEYRNCKIENPSSATYKKDLARENLSFSNNLMGNRELNDR